MTSNTVKSNGIHYTPPELADFLAAVTVEQLGGTEGAFEVLDPACGDGALLYAFAKALPDEARQRCTLVGYETDAAAVEQAIDLLRLAGVANVVVKLQDFLAGAPTNQKQRRFFEPARYEIVRRFDAIIANPPYVRTQVLGAAKAQALAEQFELTGRVDLYHAFVKAMASVLKPGGTLGLLTSNRFLTIKSGAAIRKLLKGEFALQEIFDLGDTKLFTAAVLPVIVVARRLPADQKTNCQFDRVYELRSQPKAQTMIQDCSSVLEALRDDDISGLVRTPTGTFQFERGVLLTTGEDEVWSLSTPDYQDWLENVVRNQSYSFDDIAKIRVGIKTTADEVFLRDDWQSLPVELQPEAELIRPLIRHYDAARWLAGKYSQTVLYPHEVVSGKRVPVNLDRFPRAKRYLEQHHARLNRRHYVIEGGRKWYEIWVPHSPSEWPQPKLVYPDIAEEPRFFLDKTGAVVNGDCYWITLREGFDPDLLMLMLAVANSTFITRYYDIAFHNKLYSGRRRFMAQYVKKFPLPSVQGKFARQIIRLVSDMVESGSVDAKREREIDRLVWQSFGLGKEV